MSTIYNIRGANGSGKTTLARAFLPPDLKGNQHGGPIDLTWYAAPTKKDPARLLPVTGYGAYAPMGTTIVVGPYNTPTGGMDNIPSFPIQQEACWAALGLAEAVIAEGVLASTVYGSWATFADRVTAAGHRFAFVYLQTPLEVCLERIRKRQEASGKVREIKTDLVADKVRAITATRERAIRDGRLVYDLPFGDELAALTDIMTGEGEHHRVSLRSH